MGLGGGGGGGGGIGVYPIGSERSDFSRWDLSQESLVLKEVILVDGIFHKRVWF